MDHVYKPFAVLTLLILLFFRFFFFFKISWQIQKNGPFCPASPGTSSIRRGLRIHKHAIAVHIHKRAYKGYTHVVLNY